MATFTWNHCMQITLCTVRTLLSKTLIIIALCSIIYQVCWLWQRKRLRIVSRNDTEYLRTVILLCVLVLLNVVNTNKGRITIVIATLFYMCRTWTRMAYILHDCVFDKLH